MYFLRIKYIHLLSNIVTLSLLFPNYAMIATMDCIYIQEIIYHLQQVEKPWKQPAKLTLRQYICICTHSRTVGKMTVIRGDFYRLPAFK